MNETATLHRNPDNLHYLARKAAGEPISQNYWLLDKDIDSILEETLEIDKKTRKAAKKRTDGKALYVTSSIALNADSIGMALHLIRKSRKDEQPYVVFVPVNRGNNHWAYLEIQVSERDIAADYFDSLGPDSTKKAEIEKIVKSALNFKENTKDAVGNPVVHQAFPDKKPQAVDTHFTAKQTDGYTCGDRVICDILKENGVNNEITQVNLSQKDHDSKLRTVVFSVLDKKYEIVNIEKEEVKKRC